MTEKKKNDNDLQYISIYNTMQYNTVQYNTIFIGGILKRDRSLSHKLLNAINFRRETCAFTV